MNYLFFRAVDCSKAYFIAVNIGYLIAIICTIIVMLVFDHGQPALLYLVPGCILSVLTLAAIRGELGLIWSFSEDEYITPEQEDEDEDADKKKDK